MQSNLDVFRHDAQGISVVFECHTLLESPNTYRTYKWFSARTGSKTLTKEKSS